MIENTIPKKFQIENIVTAYTSIYVAHASFMDADIVGKAYWINDSNRIIDNRVDRFYSVLSGLTSDTTYSIQGAYYDAMIDDELLDNKISIQLSDKQDFLTKKRPTITSYEVLSEQVDVGVGSPVLVLALDGYADSYYVDYKVSGSTDPYSSLFTSSDSGASSLSIPMTTGTFDIRLVGKIRLPDGVTWDISTPFEIKNIKVEYKFTPPSAPNNLTFKAAKMMDGIERYDLQVSWTWNKGSGANVREFVLYFVTESEYNKTKWTKAQTINGGSSKAVVITGFPYDVRHKFKAVAVAWGPDKESSTESAEAEFIIDKNTILDSSFTKDTGIEVTYSHIKAYQQSGTSRYQTFLLDAATGAMSIGKLDAQGVAPISVDPVNGNVNVDGSVIAKTIYSASFVMSNLTGKDNPEIRTASKTSFGGASDGMWMGYAKDNAKFKFDLGSSTKYIRWDGDNLIISGKVQVGTPEGNVDIGTGVQGNYMGFVYKAAPSKPAAPIGSDYPPLGWSIVPPTTTETIWVSTAPIDSKTDLVQVGKAWSVPIQYSGADGARGAGIYAQARTSTGWSDSEANSFFVTNFRSPPTHYDVLTQYLVSNPTIATTKQWNGTSWGDVTFVIHGDTIVDGTLTARKLVADEAFLANIGVNRIYNRDAAISSNPEANYKMKIDLLAGSIHIR